MYGTLILGILIVISIGIFNSYMRLRRLRKWSIDNSTYEKWIANGQPRTPIV